VKTVTNTNDFRRYSYQSDPAYLIDKFDFQRGSQAPKLRPEVKPEQEKTFTVRENKTIKSKAELKREQKLSFSSALKVAVVAVVSFVLIALVINSFSVKNELTRQIETKETEIANAQNEYISLQSELDSLISMSMIDEYAVEELGMVKVKSNQIQYMDVSAYKAQREASLRQSSPATTAKQITKTTGNK
jgi:cell division protein FtsL